MSLLQKLSYTYDPWGVPTVTGKETIAALNPCSYRCYEYDEETGYYYLQSRYYNPENGRFLNADDTAYIGSSSSFVSANVFAYCNNSPMMMSDPDGHEALEWAFGPGILIVVEAIVSFVAIVAIAFSVYLLLQRITKNWRQSVKIMQAALQCLIDVLELVVIKAITAKKNFKIHKHHIIAKNAWRATPARSIWKSYGKSMDDPWNLVALAQVFHARLHTTAYYAAVNEIIKIGNRNGEKGVIDSLRLIGLFLMSFNSLVY